MIKTHVRNRASGKTTEVIIRLKENKELAALVPYTNMRSIYPTELLDRVFTIDEMLNVGLKETKFAKLLVDEGFLMPADKIAKLYYTLGEAGWDIEVYGTI